MVSLSNHERCSSFDKVRTSVDGLGDYGPSTKTMNDTDRWQFWSQLGATDDEATELTAYARSGVDPSVFERVIDCPLPDEPFVVAWERYVACAARIGTVASLRQAIMQLRFPIADGMSANPAYVAAVRRGVWTADSSEPGVLFVRPDALQVFIHPTAAGRVPVIVAAEREDFVSLVRAVTLRNEPRPIPPAMGACIVAGYNNWDRVAALGPAFESLVVGSPTRQPRWGAVGSKALYQDRFIILSSGPYSGVPAGDLGVDPNEWLRISLTIRLEHECAHYVTRHALGTMRNSMLDELIADYIGLVWGAGRYRTAWFLRFLGLDASSGCREDGRIHTYRGTPPLCDGAFAILQRAIRRAARHLEAFDEAHRPSAWDTVEAARMIVALAATGLEGLASDDACDRLDSATRRASTIVVRGPALYRIEAGI
jgi:hypothetical protein